MTRKNWTLIVVAFLLVTLPAVMFARAGRGQNPQSNSADKPEKQSTQTLKIDVDLVLVNATRVIVAELKTRTGKLTERQAVWLDMLRHTGLVEVYCWRPGDWPAIVACLERPTP